MENRLEENQLAAWRAFITAHAVVIDSIERDLAAAKRLPLSSYDVLIELAEAPEGRMRMSDLARSVVLSRSGLTRLVDRLETEGLLRRESVAGDRRGTLAVITEAGREAMRQAWPVYAAGIAAYFARHLSDDELAALTAGLGRVLAAGQPAR
jgi:DNA-binding MarR family transcriptional regulator